MQDRDLHIRISETLDNQIRDFCTKKKYTRSFFLKCILTYFFKDDNAEKIMFRDASMKTDLIYAIHRYGNNVNQIAHHLNIAQNLPNLSDEEKRDIQETFEQLRNQTEIVQEIKTAVVTCLR